MSNYCVKVFTDDSNVKEWEDLNPDEIHHIEFKGKRYDEVRHGRWIDVVGAGGMLGTFVGWECTICGYEITDRYGQYNYCPNCGAKMDEVDE